MPELPEVETTKLGITPYLIHQIITDVIVRQPKLRVSVTANIQALCSGKEILNISRHAKYLVLRLTEGYLLIHLGMSGHLRIVNAQTPPGKHDHIDLCLANGVILRYNDPRRFGLWIYITSDPLQHSLLNHLGPEPLSDEFNGHYLKQRAQRRTQCIKSFIMCNQIVVGVGNIYATESLFLAGINPMKAAGTVPQQQLYHLSAHIKSVLQQAIEAGGTTLRDFYAVSGKPGYFSNHLNVYGRQSLPCLVCQTPIKAVTIAGRKSAFCPQCQS